MANINDHFLIVDLNSAALVSEGASINWLCFPHFDSESMFAKILDKKAGEFSINTEKKKYDIETCYMKNTPIVKTIFKKGRDKFTIKDFMVPQPRNKVNSHILVRKIHAFKGDHEIKLIYKPKINYGKISPNLHRNGNSLKFSLKDGGNVWKEKIILH